MADHPPPDHATIAQFATAVQDGKLKAFGIHRLHPLDEIGIWAIAFGLASEVDAAEEEAEQGAARRSARRVVRRRFLGRPQRR